MASALGATTLVLASGLARARRVETRLRHALAHAQANEHVLKERAYFDHLTGLANRALLVDRFQQAIERSKRSRKPFATVMVDLDDFKAINDTHGHAAGDQVLVEIGKRLSDTVRASDTASRLGGDEFVLIIESIEDHKELVHIGQKLISALSASVQLDSGAVVDVGSSLGFAVYPTDGNTMDRMLEVADQAMYACKTSGLMTLH